MKVSALLGAALATLVAFTAPAVAGPEVNTALGGVLVDGKPAPGLAVHGFDVIAYHTEGRPAQGLAKFAVKHGEATYRF